jgi:uncharacterized protein with HEPN domain
MNKKNSIYLGHILDFIAEIEEFKDSVVSEPKLTTAAVLYNLTLIGEAVNRISNEVKEKYPDIPWREIVGFRNRIIHEYDGVDVDILTNVIFMEIPILKSKISLIYKEVVDSEKL